MKTGPLFVLLCLGYGLIWLVGVSLPNEIMSEKGPLGTIPMILLATGIFLYPPTAISFLFHQRTKSIWWKTAVGVLLLGSCVFMGWTNWVLDQNHGGYAALGIMILGTVVAATSSIIAIYAGTLPRAQHRFTRLAAGVSAISLIPIGIALLTGWLASWEAPFLIAGAISIFASCSALLALALSAFLGERST